MLEKLFQDAKDLHVAKVKVYHKTTEASNQKAYADAAFTKTIDSATLKDAFLKGCVVVSGTKLYAPVAYDSGLVIATAASTVVTLAPVDAD